MGKQQEVKQVDTDLNRVSRVRRGELVELQAAEKDPFQITRYDVTARSMDIKGSYEQREGKEAAIAGHMILKCATGKASFCSVQGLKGSIQVYVVRDSVGEESYRDFKKMDISDIVGVEGKAFTTKIDEIFVHAAEVTLLSKSLQVLPGKLHNLTDMDMHCRQRYADLIMNVKAKNTFVRRSRTLTAIRKYLGGEGFMEMETPMLTSSAGGAAARPFETHFNALGEDSKLHIPLELYLKGLIVGGFERAYEIGHALRNEGLDTRHNPEFALVELYQAYTNYNGMMDLTEKLYRFMAQEVLGITTIACKGVEVDLGESFARITMVNAVEKYTGVSLDQIRTPEEARAIAKEKGVEFEGHHKKGDILNLPFEELAEGRLVQSTFVLDHPARTSPPTKKKPDNLDYVERFEFFTNDWETTNAHSEINDPIDQGKRFRVQKELLAQGDEEANRMDEDFLNVPEIDTPPTGGIGFGIDRMIMLLTDSPAIRDVLLLLAMKPLPNDKQEDLSIYAGLGTSQTE